METIATLAVVLPIPLATVAEELSTPEAVTGFSERRLGEVRLRSAARAATLVAPEIDDREG